MSSPNLPSTMTDDVKKGQAILVTIPSMEHKTINGVADSSEPSQALIPDCTLVEWELDPEHAVQVSLYEHVAQASDKLPLDSTKLFFVSPGTPDLAHGFIVVSDDGEPGSDMVTVDVLACYNSRRYFQQLTKKLDLRLLMDQTIIVTAKNRWSNLPASRHQIRDWKDTLRFDELSLSTENSSIYVDSVVADTVSVYYSTIGLIKGYFNVFRSLDFETSNGPIMALVGLLTAVCRMRRNRIGRDHD
ncbi:hypothetical protein FOMPIDRAFT_1045880 [Fomitopsis schrenkii]|uniref:Uncharacterized protein n=1 Tax=Fomitopsis schrenkii TaxID=2126942 RepID=S8G2T1_FOMSC|nr:hypothetical protein FOMPIDRAFT_1045880 [Fomitopsis schrenkii]